MQLAFPMTQQLYKVPCWLTFTRRSVWSSILLPFCVNHQIWLHWMDNLSSRHPIQHWNVQLDHQAWRCHRLHAGHSRFNWITESHPLCDAQNYAVITWLCIYKSHLKVSFEQDFDVEICYGIRINDQVNAVHWVPPTVFPEINFLNHWNFGSPSQAAF